ncbi:MinD/ParA family ATP-binding protein [Nocardia sp. IBHARD005]|uniref:MinD/ParA family ATP-binding protein n=1 Tax=Nocardia sp. IBHARD005 TaxID=3457765 RepID=UPI0040581DDC
MSDSFPMSCSLGTSGPRPHAIASTTPRPVLVVGGCGGAGTTTTVLGLCAAAAADQDGAARPVAVDATDSGGDLAVRGADARYTPATLQHWLAADTTTGLHSPPEFAFSYATSGAAIVAGSADPLPHRTTLATVHRRLTAAAYLPVFDGGAAVQARRLRPLLGELALVLVIPARRDAANRLRPALAWLDSEFGERAVTSATLVVSHQTSTTPPVAQRLRDHLTGWIRDVLEIPHDPHLAEGTAIIHSRLQAGTRAAYSTVLKGIRS